MNKSLGGDNMSEEIIKNQPGAGGDLGGTTPGLYQGQGAFASGGICLLYTSPSPRDV
jgi:hypothetical protein